MTSRLIVAALLVLVAVGCKPPLLSVTAEHITLDATLDRERLPRAETHRRDDARRPRRRRRRREVSGPRARAGAKSAFDESGLNEESPSTPRRGTNRNRTAAR